MVSTERFMVKTIFEKNYPYQAAGRTWAVPELRLTPLPDGTVVILEEEINHIHRAIANEICGSPENLTIDELEFLCDITLTSFTDIADYLGIHKSTLTRWRKVGEVPRLPISLLLKKWFWFKLFGQDLGNRSVKIGQLENERDFLSYARDQAIQKELANPIEKITE